jgi:hypothetical protein
MLKTCISGRREYDFFQFCLLGILTIQKIFLLGSYLPLFSLHF